MLRMTEVYRPEWPIRGGTFGLPRPGLASCESAATHRDAAPRPRTGGCLDAGWSVAVRGRAPARHLDRRARKSAAACAGADAGRLGRRRPRRDPGQCRPVPDSGRSRAHRRRAGRRRRRVIRRRRSRADPLRDDRPGPRRRRLAYATRLAILNAFVLAPAGVYLPLLFRSLRAWRGLILLAVAGGVSVEAGQLAISTVLGFHYRTIDIDDVILNAIGIVVGWAVLRVVLRVRDRPARQRCSET